MTAGRPRQKDTERVCRVCGEEKPIDDFPKTGGKSNGRRTICKPCYAAAQNARYHDKVNAARRERWHKLCAERWAAAQARFIERMMEKAG